MVNSCNSCAAAGRQTSHRCGLTCLGPLTFHPQAMGNKVRLSEGGRLAEKTTHTFRNGLVFSSRPVKVKERIQLRVEKDVFNWYGALRVGFTTVPPSDRFLPLPCIAIPDLTDRPGHWAAPVCESYCQAGSVLEFWVSRGGTLYVKSNNSSPHRLLCGIDLSRPLWAMVDIYGQTCSIYLLGSKKKEFFYTRRSCPAPKRLTSPNGNPNDYISGVLGVYENRNDNIFSLKTVPADEVCVVCMAEEARITLPCGHRCLCNYCVPRIILEFDTCPLCRHVIRDLSENETNLTRQQESASTGH